jgi:lipopolysaccharide transport system permease protein
MNPHARPPVSLASLVSSLRGHRELIVQLTRREVVGRYRGSVMGLLWSLLNPILLLAMYTFFFSVVFKARWGGSEGTSRADFALLIFVGMIVHGLLAETLVRAPTLIISNVSYVKKIVFPLEVLPVVSIGAALFHAGVSLLVLAAALLVLHGSVPWTWLLVPLVLLPFVVLALGLAWILASLGVFLRDIAHPIGFVMTVLLFASPVFYPVSVLPPSLQAWAALNPLTFPIEQARRVLIDGQLPRADGLALYSTAALLVAWTGYAWFQKTRRGFANVL